MDLAELLLLRKAVWQLGEQELIHVPPIHRLVLAHKSEEARLFPLRHAYAFTPGGVAPAGAAGVGSLSGNYTTPNPAVGAVFTYHVKQDYSADTKSLLTVLNSAGDQVRRCELNKTAGLRRITWNLNADPSVSDTSAGRGGGGGRGGAGAGRAGGAGAAGQAAAAVTPPTAVTPPVAPAIALCQPPVVAAAAGGGGGGGGRGGAAATRVAPDVYRASISKMVGTTVTQIGPVQAFSVLPLLEAR